MRCLVPGLKARVIRSAASAWAQVLGSFNKRHAYACVKLRRPLGIAIDFGMAGVDPPVVYSDALRFVAKCVSRMPRN